MFDWVGLLPVGGWKLSYTVCPCRKNSLGRAHRKAVVV